MAKVDNKKKPVISMPETDEEKKKALQSAIAHITKTYGTGAIMRLGTTEPTSTSRQFPPAP